MSTSVLLPPKGIFMTMSSTNSNNNRPATPMEPKHKTFSMKIPFTAIMRRTDYSRPGAGGGNDPRHRSFLIATF